MNTLHATYLIVWFLLQTLCFSSAERSPVYTLYSERKFFANFSADQQCDNGPPTGENYQTLVLSTDSSELYVGGYNVLKVVDTSSFNITALLSPNCRDQSESFVSIIEPLTDTCLLVCTTEQRCCFMNTTDQNLTTSDFRGDSVPTDLSRGVSWKYIHDMEQMFTGIGGGQAASTFRFTNLTGCNSASTDDFIKADSSDAWLNHPDFVGEPFLYNDYIYFIYREYSSEDINAAGRIIYSRVARVCQNDTGGEAFTDLEGDFTTFQKARLDCSLKQDDDVQFEYNEIQGIYMSGKTIFAVFTTPENGVASSAVCVYNVVEIEDLFENGQLRGQPANGQLWIPLDPLEESINFDKLFKCSEVPLSLVPDDRAILLEYPLMNLLVPNKRDYKDPPGSYLRASDAPLFVLDDVRFSQIVVHENVQNDMDVMFIGTERGTVIKAFVNDTGAFLVEEVDCNVGGEPEAAIKRMVKGNSSESLPFVSNGNCFFRLPLQFCSSRSACDCEQDPYCVCNGSSCVARTDTNEAMQGSCICVPEFPDDCNITVVRPAEEECEVWVHQYKPANLNFAAHAAEGAGLTAREVCICESEDSTVKTETKVISCVSSGLEVVIVNAVISKVNSDCTCSVNFTTSCGFPKTTTVQIKMDSIPVLDGGCHAEVTEFDKAISKYKFDLNNWKNTVLNESDCEIGEDLGYCTKEC